MYAIGVAGLPISLSDSSDVPLSHAADQLSTDGAPTWAEFLADYSAGIFDPSRPPIPPRALGIDWTDAAFISSEDASRTLASVMESIPKGEAVFRSGGFLPPPPTTNESQRQKALYRYNILHTGPDVNFDRIADLVKVVFNAKWALITMIDDDGQYFKHTSGLDLTFAPRDITVCGHTILQQSNEVTTVLDSRKDWRFMNNPFVLGGGVEMRFYVGAPLRTSDGHNIGTLCIADVEPRVEFTQTEKETLKDFAAVVLREMDMWRDKVQLRVRDRIQSSMEKFTRDCIFIEGKNSPGKSMSDVFDDAVQLVMKTLDVSGAQFLDVSSWAKMHPPGDQDNKIPLVRHGSAFWADEKPIANDHSGSPELNAVTFSALDVTQSNDTPVRHDVSISHNGLAELRTFLTTNKEGGVYYRDCTPSWCQEVLPPDALYIVVVPIFDDNGEPFTVLSAYTTVETKKYLEGHELQFLRAIGSVIQNARLKRQMIMADAAKSLFISNISHELRTPLHGILAAAELLDDSGLFEGQAPFLKTVQACGTSLAETVNHVLDFSKLSGTAKNTPIKRSTVDLVSLLEETVEGAWVGSQGRLLFLPSGLASTRSSKVSTTVENMLGADGRKEPSAVEIILEIEPRSEGWILTSDKGGLQRVLLNIIGNSLKFTESGYIHVVLRTLSQNSHETDSVVQLVVRDTGKGMSPEFIKNRLFQPFSQEDKSRSGTGLGLAIVKSIIQSEGINGTLDVHSTLGIGTETIITLSSDRSGPFLCRPLTIFPDNSSRVLLQGFNLHLAAQNLLYGVIISYLKTWCKAEVTTDHDDAGVILVNEDMGILHELTRREDFSRPVILLSTSRRNDRLATFVERFESRGGFCRLVFKPCRPRLLRQAFQDAVNRIYRIRKVSTKSTPAPSDARLSPIVSHQFESLENTLPRNGAMATAGTKCGANGDWRGAPIALRDRTLPKLSSMNGPSLSNLQKNPRPAGVPSSASTIASLPSKSCSGGETPSANGHRSLRILVVEDNRVNRVLLSKWLIKQGHCVQEAEDGQHGFDVFAARESGYFDVVLMDISMPVLDGIGSTRLIRALEAKRSSESDVGAVAPLFSAARSPNVGDGLVPNRSKILVLSGLATKDDKLHAFDAGVDGYLVKPVSFKHLSQLLSQIGSSAIL